jgi:hypothetical protein
LPQAGAAAPNFTLPSQEDRPVSLTDYKSGGPKAEEFSHAYQGLPQVQTDSELAVDPIHTSYDNIVLQNGATLVRKYD